MIPDTPFDLLMECGGCGIENLFPGFIPGTHLICKQCRENMLAQDFSQTHQGHTCASCGMILLVKAETDLIAGESECQCGGTDFVELGLEGFVVRMAEAQKNESDDDDPNFDWCRSAPGSSLEGDYNEIFDDDPGFQ